MNLDDVMLSGEGIVSLILSLLPLLPLTCSIRSR
jgi:hypothetical protein